jgi:GDPmannose 4,6-dehydratase
VLKLGNVEARRDWGYAKDYVRGMWLMLQQSAPADYVIATGETHSVREFCEIAFRRVGLDYRQYVISDASNTRPADAATLVGDASKARRQLGWGTTVSFQELVHLMVDEDLAKIGRGTR